MDKWIRSFVSRLVSELRYHTFIAPYMGIRKNIQAFIHQYESLGLLSVSRPVRLLLADEIGLGKTITAISVAKYLESVYEASKIIIIVPRILVNQWIIELNGMGINNIYQIERNTIEHLRKQGFPDGYYLGSIDLIKRERYVELLSSIEWDLVIIDEAHKLSIKGSKKTQRYNEIGGKLIGSRPNVHALLLTATPHKGDPEDYISRLKLLDPQLGSPRELNQRNFYRCANEVLVMKRTKEDINQIYEMKEVFKPAFFYALTLSATNEERQFNSRLLEFMRTKMLEFARNNLSMNIKVIPLIRALLFKRASSSPQAAMLTINRMLFKRSTQAGLNEDIMNEVESLFDIGYDDYEYESRQDVDEVMDEFADAVSDLLSDRDRQELMTLYGFAEQIVRMGDTKVKALIESLEYFLNRGEEKMIVFTEYRDTLRYIKTKILQTHPEWNRKVLSLSSHEALDKEAFKKIRDKFEGDPICRILLATDVAAEGLNLQVANILFNYEIPWSIVKLEQRMGRVWRLGQKREVSIYTLFLDNKSDQDALNVVYRKLLNLKNAELGVRPLLGREVITLEETDANEVGKIPMELAEKGSKFRKITEHTLIDAYIRGGKNQLAAIARSILEAKRILEDRIERNSVFYRKEKKEELDERIKLFGFQNPSELLSSLKRLFLIVASAYGYRVSGKNDELRVERPTGMPMIVSRVDELIDLMVDNERPEPTLTPTFVAYGNTDENIFIYVVSTYGKDFHHLLRREPIGISDKTGSVLEGKSLLDNIYNAFNFLIGVDDRSGGDLVQIDNILLSNGTNSFQSSSRHLLDRVEKYLSTMNSLKLRNNLGAPVRQKDLVTKISNCIGILKFVRKPLSSQLNISTEVGEAERIAANIVLEIERHRGMIVRELSAEEKKTNPYDIHSFDPNSGEEHIIKVKGNMGPEVFVELTSEEAHLAQKEGEKYWLYLIYNIRDKFKILSFSNPFLRMSFRVIGRDSTEKRFELWPRQYQ